MQTSHGYETRDQVATQGQQNSSYILVIHMLLIKRSCPDMVPPRNLFKWQRKHITKSYQMLVTYKIGLQHLKLHISVIAQNILAAKFILK